MVTTYLITGASSGIGLELVKQLSSRGDDTKIYATCRKTAGSKTGIDEISSVAGGNVTVIPGIDVTSDDVGSVLKEALGEGTTIDVVVHNAGSLTGGGDDVKTEEMMSHQKLGNVTMDRMRAAFEVNTLGPLRVQQAISGMMKSPGGKIAIISTGFASISDNSSGGTYAYRTSKAGVNMISKCLSCDLKDQEIAVMSIAPGFVATDFGPGKEKMKSWGAMPVDQSCRGIIKLLDSMSMDNTGTFYLVQKNDQDAKEYSW